ncbi:class I adenylate-forming enzyme family protein [Hyphococcus luteus]|uniref:Long-chain fatty acid--CoA ligase n=1 Tax=Hyphococcus luteus TaxID=2058213 RepID=A0A2S7K5N6_9PROT|nr:class I adenylate-forming enzyme family protein [Marinicaulis flavus]PQA87786.1 long-chain fatty acid--CoA ligase [Marinicaulis flavus]
MADPAPLDPAKTAAAAFKLLAENPMFKVGEAEIRGAAYRVFENAPKSLAGLFAASAVTHGEKEFLIFEDERISFAELWRRACRLANALHDELGVKQGDKVALAMRNYPEWCVSYMAVIALGAVVVPLNAWWKEEELHYGLQDCGAKIVIADKKRLDYIAPLKDELGLTLVLAREEGGADYRYEDLIAGAKSDAAPDVDIHPDDDFCIVYTSGSTGHPKGVVLTHRGAISTLFSWSFVAAVLKEVRGGVSPFGDDPGILLAIPLFHVTGSHSIFLLSYMVGRRMAMMYRWDPKEAANIINREKLTNFVGVPSQSFELMQAVGPEGLPSLIDIGSGGAKRPAEHVKKLAKKFEYGKPSSGYGLSETNALGCVISQGDYLARPDSTGRPVPPVTDIKIMNEAGEEVPRGEAGEIWIKSPANFRGYHNLPEDTAKSITPDGWFRTGDLGKMDKEDYLYIVDRIKDVIIRGGENISCLEVENRVYEHGDVAEAVVFSVPDEVMGERVGLVVYPKDGMSIDVEDLRRFIAEDLAEFKVPERIWISPSKLPRLGTAKFDKITVRKIALQHPPALSV